MKRKKRSTGFQTKDDQAIYVAKAKTYTRDPTTDLWSNKAGKKFRLNNHGTIRIDLVPV